MIENLSNSFKAKMYDFTYSPFMSSFVISWILLNHKYLLIYFTEFSLDKKLLLLEKYDFSYMIFSIQIPIAFNFYMPLLFGLFYTFIYPLISKVFYEYTLKRNKELKSIKQKIQDDTPLTQEEARKLRRYNNDLISQNYQLEKQISEQNKATDNSEEVEENIKTGNKDLEDDDRTKIEKYLYYNSYDNTKSVEEFKRYLVNGTKIPRAKVTIIFHKLINDNILTLEKKSYGEIVKIFNDGNEYLLNKFDKEKTND